ncbi:MAG: prolyl oligopeptidase family serine peptidase [Vicinamibacterales bacterium]
MTPSRRTTASALAILLATIALAAAQAKRAMTLDDVLDLVQVSAPRISPDGSRLLFTRSEIKEWKDNKRVATVWIANSDGSGQYQFLASDKDRAPQWSPDGSHVAFLSTRDVPENDKDAGPQIWVIRTTGGEAVKLTDHKGEIKLFEWAADGSRIFFLAEEAESEAEKAAKKAGEDAIFVDEGPNGQDRGRYGEIWEIALADRQARKVSKGPLLIQDFKPSPDGRRVAVIHRPDNRRNSQYLAEVALLDVASGELKNLTRNEAPEQDVSWSPDGSQVTFVAPSDTGWDLATNRLWVVPAGGGAQRRIGAGFDGQIGAYFWTPDGRSILVGGMRRARSGVFALDVTSGTVRTIATGDWNGTMESMTRDRRRGAVVTSAPGTPGEVMVVDAADGRLARVTNANPHAGAFATSQFRAMSWKSRDGLEVEGLLWLPAGYTPGTTLPLVLSIHGGPAGVWTTAFRGINHVYTGLGWAVLEPNVRGSSSYGDALLRGNMRDIGGGDYEDLMAGVDKLVADGIADPARLAVRGWSYGGILGGWTITQTNRFKAASLGAMVADWPSEYAMGFNHDVRLWYIGGTPWENPEGFRQKSAYAHIAKVQTPTIVIHGERDTTDTIGQSMIFYQGLKDRGVPVRFIRFPREPHGFREPAHQRIRDAEEIAWLMKHTLGIEWKALARPEKKDEKKTTTP